MGRRQPAARRACARQSVSWLTTLFSRAPRLYTGRTVPADEIRVAFGVAGTVIGLGKRTYAEVDSGAVVWLAQQARDALWREGINRWQKNATCTLFAAKFATLANEKFYAAAFFERSGSPLTSAGSIALAVGEVWFHPDTTPPGEDHAIGCAFTERGLLAVDPQSPDTLRELSATERLTIRPETRFL